MKNFRLFIQLSRPLFLLGVVLIYALGASIARYLGFEINWMIYWVGQLWVTLLQMSVQYLNEYFNAPMDQNNPNRTFLTGGSGALGPGKLPRQTALFAALVTLAFLASMTVIVIANVRPDALAYLIMILAFLGGILYSMPPVALESTGYGELTTTFLVAFLVPAYAFVLQAGELHRLVAMIAFPLAAVHLAMLIALELPDYATDLRYGKRTMIVRMGWEKAMTLHNILVVSAYLLLLLAFSFRYPWFATWPAFLTIPLGFFQIFQIRQIARGAKPNWNALTIGATALFALMAYLTAFAFWVN